jgi:hypothetical protein
VIELRDGFLDQPHEVSIETLALCNAACNFCPYPTLERQGTKMPDAMLARLCDEMAQFEKPFYFSPFKVNEPLLDSRLIPTCRRMEGTKAVLRIFTNGQPLTQEKIDEIAQLKNVAHLWVSLNSHIPEEYERLMRLDFEKTAKRLDNLHSQDFPHRVILSCVGFPNEAFRYYCFQRWPKFESLAIRKGSWLGAIEPQDTTIPDTSCGRWFELSVMANGIVALCCMDGEGKFPLGDVNKQTLLEVYNQPHLRQRREQLASRRGIYPCSTCTL